MAQTLDIPWARIRPNPLQPRRHFPREELDELRASIRRDGLLQPILVRPGPMHEGEPLFYYLIAGERRWRASEGVLDMMPCVVRDVPGLEAGRLALIENIQRAQLSPMDEAFALETLMLEAAQQGQKLTHADLLHETGKGRGWLSGRLALLKMPVDLQEMVARNADTLTHSHALRTVKDEVRRKQLIEQVERGLTVEALVPLIVADRERAESVKAAGQAPDAQTQARARQFRRNRRGMMSRGKLVTGESQSHAQRTLDEWLSHAERGLLNARAWAKECNGIAPERAQALQTLLDGLPVKTIEEPARE